MQQHSQVEALLHPDRTALLVVDMQEEFTHPESRFFRWLAARRGLDVTGMPDYDPHGPSRPGDPDQEEIPTLRGLIEFCRRHSVRVIWARTIVTEETSAKFWKAMGLRQCLEGEWTIEFSAGLEPEPGETIITKTRHSVFYNTNLEEVLREAGIETLLITGRGTAACVEAACRDAMARDLGVVVVSDCCGGVAFDNAAAIAKIGQLFGFAATAQEVMGILVSRRSASTASV